MLYANAAEQGMEVVGDVAGRKYSGNVGSAHGIDQQAVVNGNSGALEDLHRRSDADGHDRKVAFQLAAIPGERAFDPIRTFKSDNLIAGHELDAGVPMDAGHELAYFWAENRLKWSRPRQNRAHLHPQLSQRRRGL